MFQDGVDGLFLVIFAELIPGRFGSEGDLFGFVKVFDSVLGCRILVGGVGRQLIGGLRRKRDGTVEGGEDKTIPQMQTNPSWPVSDL